MFAWCVSIVVSGEEDAKEWEECSIVEVNNRVDEIDDLVHDTGNNNCNYISQAKLSGCIISSCLQSVLAEALSVLIQYLSDSFQR
jgi:DNA-binding IscR family transcriptional regulator